MTTELTGDYVTIEPDWHNLVRWWANALATHSFEKFAYAPVASFVDMIRYMTLTDPKAVEALTEELHTKDQR